MSPFDRAFIQLSVDSAGVVDEAEKFRAGSFSCVERLSTSSVSLVGEILGESGSGATDTKTPSLEGRSLVGKTR